MPSYEEDMDARQDADRAHELAELGEHAERDSMIERLRAAGPAPALGMACVNGQWVPIGSVRALNRQSIARAFVLGLRHGATPARGAA